MCKQGGRVKLFCPTLAKRYERRVQTFKIFFLLPPILCNHQLSARKLVEPFPSIYELIFFWNKLFLDNPFILIHLMTCWTLGSQSVDAMKHV